MLENTTIGKIFSGFGLSVCICVFYHYNT